jgi:hypothetical protein
MKKGLHRITALAAAAVTLLSAAGMPASAYEVTHGNFQNLTQNYHGAGAGYCWGTKEQQDALPQFTPTFLSRAQAVIARFQPGQFYATHMFCTLDEAIISRDILRDPVKAENARRQIDKLSVERKGGTPFGLKLEYEGHGRNNGLSSFGLRLMTSYDLNFYLYDRMYVEMDYHEYDFMGEDVVDLDDPTGAYSGRIYFDDLYIAGMRVSCSDPFTKFGEPVITWEYGEPTVYVPFSGMIPTPDHPVFEGVYDKIMTREEFDLYFGFLRPNGERFNGDVGGSARILTDLTVSYNYGSYVPSKKMTYTTNDHVRTLIAPQLTSCY